MESINVIHHVKSPSSVSEQDILVRVDKVSKKFCRSLKKSLWYGVQDISRELVGKGNTNELRKDEFWAVDSVSFELRRGECLGLIGHNGAGKSTLLKMLNGLIKPDKGRIEMRGRVGALIELGTGFNPILTGRENIYNNAAVLGFTKEEVDQKFHDIVEFSEIGEFLDTPVQNYSSGMKVRLGFAVAAQLEPDILIIDEVLAVGDLGFKIKCLNKITDLLDNTAVIFVSHSMPQVIRICDRILLLTKGKMTLDTFSIAEGVELFFDQFEDDVSKANGDIIEIQEFNLNSNNLIYQNDSIFQYKDDLVLKFSFKTKYSYDKLSIRIAVFDKEMKQLAISSELFNQILSEKLYEITFEVNNILFATGTYYLSIVFYQILNKNGKIKTLANFRSIERFKVKAPLDFGQAPILLESNWSISENS